MNVSSNKEVLQLLEQKNLVVFGIGAFPTSRIEFSPFLPEFHIVCSTNTFPYHVNTQNTQKIHLFVVSDVSDSLIKKPNKLLNNRALTYIRAHSKGKTVALLTFKPNAFVEDVCRKNNWHSIAQPYYKFERLSSREYFHTNIEPIFSLKSKKLSLGDLNKESVSALFYELGKNIVCKIENLDGAGKGVLFFSQSNSTDSTDIKKSIQKRIEKNKLPVLETQQLIFQPFYSGVPMSICACITKENGVISESVKSLLINLYDPYTNINMSGIYCGNTWSKTKNTLSLQQQARSIVQKIGLHLAKENYFGTIGVDLLWNSATNTLVPIELNPRLPGSLPTASDIYLGEHSLSPYALHVLELLQIPYTLKTQTTEPTCTEATQLIIRNIFRFDVHTPLLRDGRYTLKNNDLHYLGPYTHLKNLTDINEFLLSRVKPSVFFIKPAKEICILQAPRALTNFPKSELNARGNRIVSAILKHANPLQ